MSGIFFLENPILGVGLGNLGYHSKFIISVHASAHNIILGLLGETGLIGCILFISLLLSNFFYLLKSYSKESNPTIKLLIWAFISSFIGCVVHSMIEPNFEGFQFSVLFWSALSVFIRLVKLPELSKLSLVSLLKNKG